MMKPAYLTVVVVLCSSAGAFGGVGVPGMFLDHMVLQQDAEVRIWGWADAGESIEIRPGWDKDNPTSVEAGQDRLWSVFLKTPKADGRSHDLIIKGRDNTIALKDVVLGELWLTGGQSNMSMGMSGWKDQPILGGAEDAAKADYPLIRMFQFRGGASGAMANNVAGGKWTVCTPETAIRFSATGFYFAREIHLKTGCPVGIIHTSIGGVRIERWIRREYLENDDDFRDITETHDQKYEEWKAAVEEAKKLGKQPPRGPHNQMPSWAYNGIIAPFRKMTIRGFAWYQGEANVGNGYRYRKLLTAMIDNWRADFGNPRMPFLVVQITNYTHHAPGTGVERYSGPPRESGYAELREAQLMAARRENVGLAVTIDIGDTDSIHPANKRDVGKRLALWTLAGDHGQDVVYSGPMYVGYQYEKEKEKIRIIFDHAETGLVAKGDRLEGFAIAGKDRKFVWADAEIDRQTVVVSSPTVAEPVAVRYAWDTHPDCNLYNRADLPASPFRTDNWRGVTFGK